jgi:cell migration-inducing and hyaluronan-binding protein
MMMGGTLSLHGNRTNAWTKLSKTADAGSTSIEVLNAAAGAPVTRSSSRPRIRSPAGRAANHCRHPGNAITLDKKLGLHALRQDHLRRG